MSRFVADRDWQPFHSPKNLAMGLAVEAAELMDLFQWMDLEESHRLARDPDQLKKIREEMADVLSFLLCLADVTKTDITQAFYEKMKSNNDKYPAQTYRGKYKL